MADNTILTAAELAEMNDALRKAGEGDITIRPFARGAWAWRYAWRLLAVAEEQAKEIKRLTKALDAVTTDRTRLTSEIAALRSTIQPTAPLTPEELAEIEWNNTQAMVSIHRHAPFDHHLYLRVAKSSIALSRLQRAYIGAARALADLQAQLSEANAAREKAEAQVVALGETIRFCRSVLETPFDPENRRRAISFCIRDLDPDVTALVADHKAGQEAVEMLNWLDANWDYAIGEPPLCVTQPKSLRDAIRAAMKGGRT